MDVVMKHLGLILLLFSLTPLVPFGVAIYLGESFMPFLATTLVALLLGIVLRIASKGGGKVRLTIQRGVALTALSFLILPLIGSMPSALILDAGVLDSVFDSYSGFTTTGLTLLPSVEDVPKSLLLWRAQSQWVGGLGIVLFALLIILMLRARTPTLSTRSRAMVTLYKAQGASQRLEPNLRKSVKRTIMIYSLYTAVGAILLMFAGMGGFQAVAMALTSVSTGGFTVVDKLDLNLASMIILSALMLVGATSFVIHNRIFKLDFKEILRSYESKVFAVVLGIAVLANIILIKDVKTAVFHTISAVTTTGYAISDITAMPYIAVMIIILCMIIGGGLGSTAGGIKMLRFGLLLKAVPWMIKKVSYTSRAVIPLKMEDRPVEESTLVMAQVFAFLYIAVLFLGTIILMLCGNSFMTSSFHITSALGTVGLQTASLAGFNALCKVVLILAMLLGRLEIFPVLVLGKYIIERIRERPSEEPAEEKPLYSRILPTELWRKRE